MLGWTVYLSWDILANFINIFLINIFLRPMISAACLALTAFGVKYHSPFQAACFFCEAQSSLAVQEYGYHLPFELRIMFMTYHNYAVDQLYVVE